MRRDTLVDKVPELVGLTEAAQLTGKSTNLIRMRLKVGKFPQPAQQLKAGPVWTRAQIDEYIKQEKRSK